MTKEEPVDGLLRELAPQALAAVARRFGNFADAEDAVQEAMVAAARVWPPNGVPDNPIGWLVRVSSRRMADEHRRDLARRRREVAAASWSSGEPWDSSGRDDTLIIMFMCCHPSLSPNLAIPLTLRAVGGLTTHEIAAAFVLPEATMAQRISRAKSKIKASTEGFGLPSEEERSARLRSVLHVLYLLFNEGHAATGGPELARADLSAEAIRLTREVRAALPRDPDVAALLALMLLSEARRPARTRGDGELVPLAEQDRSLWDRRLISEGLALITETLRGGYLGEYQIQAAIAAVHDQAPRYADTDWAEILSLYGLLERLTGNPMVSLNRAIAAGAVHGPGAGLAILEGLDARLGDHHRFHSTRAHLLELAGETGAAVAELQLAAGTNANVRERRYLIGKAARLESELEGRGHCPGDQRRKEQ